MIRIFMALLLSRSQKPAPLNLNSQYLLIDIIDIAAYPSQTATVIGLLGPYVFPYVFIYISVSVSAAALERLIKEICN